MQLNVMPTFVKFPLSTCEQFCASLKKKILATALISSFRLVSQTVVAGNEMENGKTETATTAENDTWTVKPKDYLRLEYRKRMQGSALQYRLQIQLRSWHEADLQGANPCMQWNAKRYPWVDLALVTIALPLQLSTVCKTKMSLLNHPQCFRLPDPTSRFDFFSLGHAMSGLHCVYDKPLINTETKRKYVITVKTGEDERGGTDADVSIAITGAVFRSLVPPSSHKPC